MFVQSEVVFVDGVCEPAQKFAPDAPFRTTNCRHVKVSTHGRMISFGASGWTETHSK